VWGAALGAGNAVGPILAAGIAALSGWRLAYEAIALAAAALAVAGRTLLSESRPVDAAGLLSGWNIAVLLSVGFSLLGALVVLLARERTAKPEPFLERRFWRQFDFVEHPR
jgi:hypothetical protein